MEKVPKNSKKKKRKIAKPRSIYYRLSAWASAARGKGAVAVPFWIFIHGTNKLKLNSAIFRSFFAIFVLYSVPPPLLEIFLPTPLAICVV